MRIASTSFFSEWQTRRLALYLRQGIATLTFLPLSSSCSVRWCGPNIVRRNPVTNDGSLLSYSLSVELIPSSSTLFLFGESSYCISALSNVLNYWLLSKWIKLFDKDLEFVKFVFYFADAAVANWLVRVIEWLMTLLKWCLLWNLQLDAPCTLL